MFNELLTRIVTKYISKYTYELNPNSMRSSLLRGIVELNNIFIRPDVLNMLLGVELRFGYIEHISLRIPWQSFWKESTAIKVSTVYVVLCGYATDLTEDAIKQEVLTNFKNKLRSLIRIEQRILEQNKGQIKEAIGITAGTEARKIGKVKKWILWLQNLAINNLTLIVSNIVILWSAPSLQDVSGVLRLQNVQVSTADDSTADQSGLKEKNCALEGLSLHYYPIVVDERPEYRYNSLAECEKGLVFWRHLFEGPSYSSVVDPFNVTITIQLCRNFAHEGKPFATIRLCMPSICCCTDLQTVLSLVKSLTTGLAAGEFAFALTSNEAKHLNKDSVLEDAVLCLGKVLARSQAIDQIESVISAEVNKESHVLKDRLQRTFKKHYSSHLRCKYIVPLLSECSDTPTVSEFGDEYLDAVQNIIGYIGPSAKILAELTASMPTSIIAKLQQECLSAFLHNLSEHIEHSKREDLTEEVIIAQQLTPTKLRKEDLNEFQKIMGIPSTLDISDLNDNPDVEEEKTELIKMAIDITGIDVSICEKAIHYTDSSPTILLCLSLQAISCSFSLLKSTDFSFLCELGLIRGECMAVTEPVLNTLNEIPAFSINVCSPGCAGGSMHIRSSLVPIQLLVVPSVLPFIISLMSALQCYFSNSIKISIQKASTLDLVTLYNEVDKDITTFLQERAATLELDLELGAPVIILSAPATESFTCSLGKVIVKSLHFLSETDHPKLRPDSQTLVLFVQLNNTVIRVGSSSKDNPTKESGIKVDLKGEKLVVKPCTMSIYLYIPLLTGPMVIDIIQGLIDVTLTTNTIQSLIVLCSRYAYEVLHIPKHEWSALMPPLHQGYQATLARPKFGMEERLEQTALLLRNKVATVIIGVTLEGVKLAVGDVKEIELHIGQGHIDLHVKTIQNKGICTEFKLSVVDLFVCGTPVVYLTNEAEDFEENRIASGVLTTDKGVTLRLEISMMHFLADIVLIIKMTSVLEKVLQIYTNAGLALLLSQVARKFSSSQAPRQDILQESKGSTITLLLDFSGLTLYLLSTPYILSLPSSLDSALSLTVDTALICTAKLKAIYLNIIVESGNIFINWSVHECTVDQSDSEPSIVTILQFVPPIVSEVCAIGCVHLYDVVSYDPNLLLDAQIIGDVVITINGRSLQYLLQTGNILMGCLLHLKEALELESKTQALNSGASKNPSRLSCNIIVPSLKISIPVHVDHNNPQFSLHLTNFGLSTDQAPGTSTIRLRGWLEQLLVEFVDSIEGHQGTYYTICEYNGLEVGIDRTYRIHHQELVDGSSNSREEIFLTHQVIAIDFSKGISMYITPRILHTAIEMISADRNLGFIIVDDTDESKLKSIKQDIDERIEGINARNGVDSTKDTIKSINSLLAHDFKGFLAADLASIRPELKLDDAFIDIVEQEYLRIPMVVDREHIRSNHLDQFCPPVVNILKISVSALQVKLLDNTETLVDCKLDKSNIVLEKTSDLQAAGSIGSLTLKATKSPFPLFDLTQMTFQYKHDSVRRRTTLLLPQETAFVVIVDHVVISMIFSLLALNYIPSALYILARQAKQELVTSINEKISILQEKNKPHTNQNGISHAILSVLHASQAKKTIVIDKPTLELTLSLLKIKFVVVVSTSDPKEDSKLEEAEHVALSIDVNIITSTSFRQKYIMNTVDYQVRDFFKRAEICVKLMLDNCKLVSYLPGGKTGTNGMQLNNIIWIPKLSCNFNTISADMQSSVTKNSQQENIILNRRSVSFETTIAKQSEITISPALLCVYALTKEKLIAAIPYEVLKEAEKIAKEELDKLKSKSMKFLKGTKDSQTEASTSLTDVFPNAVLNSTPILVSGFHFPVYTVSNNVRVEMSFKNQPLLVPLNSSQNSQPLFIIGCNDIKFVYESTLETSPNVPHQALHLTTTLYAKSYNEALKLYDVLLCSTPLAFSYKMWSRSAILNDSINKAVISAPPTHDICKTMPAEISVLFSAPTEFLVLLTPTSLLATIHFINTFSIPASGFSKIKSAAENKEAIPNCSLDEHGNTPDETLILSIPTTQPAESEGQQAIEFYPSSIIKLVKVYSGTSECEAHRTPGETIAFYIPLNKIDETNVWVEVASEGVVKTTQFPLQLLLFHEQYKIDDDWMFAFVKQDSKVEVHCLSTYILLNYTTRDYSIIVEAPASNSIQSTSQLYSSTETTSAALSSMLTSHSIATCASVDYNICNRTQVIEVLRKNSYISAPNSALSIQIASENHDPLELTYYLRSPAINPLETFIIEKGYEYMRLIAFTIYLFGRPTQVLQLVPTHFIINGMPCMAELKLDRIQATDNNSGLEIKDETVLLAPAESGTLNTSLKDEIRLASLSIELQYGDETCKYVLKTTKSLPYDEDTAPTQSVILELASVRQYNIGVYHCNASIRKQTMKKIPGIGTSLLTGLYAPSAVEIKIYASALLQNSTAPGLSFCIFRLDSKYDKRTQITSAVRYGEAAIVWGKYSDSVKLSVSTSSNGHPIQYHKSDVFKLSTFAGYHLHRMHTKAGKKQMTLFVYSKSKQLRGSPSMIYTLCAAIEVSNCMSKPISVLIAPWDHKDKVEQKTVCVNPNSNILLFELPGTKESLIDYAIRFLEDQTSLLKRLRIGYSKELLHIDSSLAVMEIHCTEHKLNITVRPPKLVDDAQLQIENSLNIDLYCSYKHSAQRTKYAIASGSTATLYFLLSNLEFYYQKPNGTFVQIFCIKMTPLSTAVEFREPKSKKKCHAKLAIRDGAVQCKIFFDNEASLKPIVDRYDIKQELLINANVKIKGIMILLVGPDDSDFSCRREYVSFSVAFIDVVFLVSTQYYRVSAQMGQIFLENILGLTNNPRVLYLKSIKSTREPQGKRIKQERSAKKYSEIPAIIFLASMSTNLSILDIEFLSIKVGKLNLHIDQSSIDVVLRFLRINSLLSMSFQIESTERQALQTEIYHMLSHLSRDDGRYYILLRKLCNCIFNPVDQRETSKSGENGILCIRQLELGELKCKATISINNLPFQLNPIISALNQIGLISFSLEDARIRIGAVRLKDRLLTFEELTQYLCKSYIKAIGMNAGNLLAATPMLGNLSSLATHFTESFRAPKNEGVTRIENFVSHNTAGIMSVARALLESTGKMLDAASMDNKYSAQRAIVLYESQKSLKVAWKNAGSEFWRELKSALAGLISKPLKGFAAKGVKGFFRGLGQGLVGSVTKSLGSINDAILHVIVGVNGSALRVCRPVMEQSRSRIFIGPLLEQNIRGQSTPHEVTDPVDSESDDQLM